MREISEITLIGNYLIFLSERLGQDSLKYESAKLFGEKVLQRLNKTSQTYTLSPIDKKMDIVRKMISKGVFKTENLGSTTTFKQRYDYELAKFIYATYSPDGNLTFKLAKSLTDDKDYLINSIKRAYSSNLSLDLQGAMREVMAEARTASSKIKLKA